MTAKPKVYSKLYQTYDYQYLFVVYVLFMVQKSGDFTTEKNEQTAWDQNVITYLSSVRNPYDIPLYWFVYGDPYIGLL